ncbi:MAG: hypothetical protein ACR2QO_28700, partial [Acidimicrobiales bacterium]
MRPIADTKAKATSMLARGRTWFLGDGRGLGRVEPHHRPGRIRPDDRPDAGWVIDDENFERFSQV